MRRIYWDTMLYAYWFENHRRYASRVEEIYKAMHRRGDTLCSSTLAYAEVLTGPIRHQNREGATAMTHFFHSSNISMLPFPTEAAPIFANIRASGIKPPDAMHLAIAAHAGVDLFLTNDKRLSRLSLPGLPLIDTLETTLY